MKLEKQINDLYKKLASLTLLKEDVIKWLHENKCCVIEFEIKSLLNNKFELELNISQTGRNKNKKLEKYFNDLIKSWYFSSYIADVDYDNLRVSVYGEYNPHCKTYYHNIIIYKE